ncbi:hypothetical protein L6R49_23750 [Myxococcota bacterium]|nr:hypothetical protein [Myxococcota bacterium]
MLHPMTLLRLTALLWGLLTLTGGAAWAQEPPHPVAAWRVVEINGVPNRPEAFALPDGDVVALRRLTPGRYTLERLGPDLRPRWSAPLSLPEPKGSGSLGDLLGAGVVSSESRVAASSSRALVRTNTAALIIAVEGGKVVAHRVELDSGAARSQTLAEAEDDRTALSFAAHGAHLAVMAEPPKGEGRFVYVFDEQLSLIFETRFVPSEDELGLWVTPQGGLVRAWVDEKDDSVRVSRLDVQAPELRLETGKHRAGVARVAFGPEGQVAMLLTLESSRGRPQAFLLAELDFVTGKPVYRSELPKELLLTGTGEGDLLSFELVELIYAPDGSLLAHGQFVQQVAMVSSSPTGFGGVTLTTDVQVRYGQVLLWSFVEDGRLRWVRAVPLNQTSDLSSAAVDTGYRLELSEADARVLYVHTPTRLEVLQGRQITRAVVAQPVALKDGAFGEREDWVALSRNETWLRVMSTRAGDDYFVMTLTRADTLQGLMGRVALGEEAPVSSPLTAPAEADRDSDDFQAGYLVGHKTGFTDVSGLAGVYGGGVGVAATGVGMTAAWALSGFNPGVCLMGAGAGCLVGAGVARSTLGAPRMSPWSAQSPDFQAGYAEGYQRGRRQRQVRWAAVGGVIGGVAVGAGLVSAEALLND